MKTYICVLSLLLVTTGAASSQEPLEAGARVRVTAADGTRWFGTVQETSLESLSVLSEQSGVLFTTPNEQLTAIEVSEGRHNQFGKYFLITLGVGIIGGGIVNAVTWEPCTDWLCFSGSSRTGALGVGMVVGGALAIPVGVIVGVFASEERWKVAPLPPSSVR